MEPASTPITQAPKNSYGSVFSILLIVMVLVAGAFYVWNKRINQDRPQQAVDDTTSAAQNAVSGE